MNTYLAVGESTAAGIITAVGTVLTAVALVITAMTLFLPALRSIRRTEKQVGVVHTLVNQQHTDQERYRIALLEVLRANGIDIPVDQSKPVTGAADASEAASLSVDSTE